MGVKANSRYPTYYHPHVRMMESARKSDVKVTMLHFPAPDDWQNLVTSAEIIPPLRPTPGGAGRPLRRPEMWNTGRCTRWCKGRPSLVRGPKQSCHPHGIHDSFVRGRRTNPSPGEAHIPSCVVDVESDDIAHMRPLPQ